ncbi:MAG: hypothetical protein IJU76_05055 [Desulfovibrionaceae bacterium]|nr:hypothetical protein [Desulfovibrionaceae bacterium]
MQDVAYTSLTYKLAVQIEGFGVINAIPAFHPADVAYFYVFISTLLVFMMKKMLSTS